MAVIAVSGSPVVGLKYTHTTASSADWGSVSNSTYFYDLTDKLVHYKDGSGVVEEIFSSPTSIPQANKIFIDSVNGVDSTGRGNINTPYLTPEYALSDIINTGTVTATTTNASATLTAVSSTASISIGQIISGTGIPWGSVVQSKTVNTIVLSQKCTASATVTVKWLTLYELNLSGNFIATSNWLKEGFSFARNESVSVSWGAFTLYDLNSIHTANYLNDGGFQYNGLTSTSKYFDTSEANPNANFVFDLNHGSLISITTSILFFHSGVYNLNSGTFNFKGKSTIAKFGTLWVSPYYLIAQINVNFDYSYGLLGGVLSQGGDVRLTWTGNIDCPASVLAVSMPGSCFTFEGNYINGSISIVGTSQHRVEFSPVSVSGTSHTIGNVTCRSRFTGNVTCVDNVDWHGYTSDSLYFTGANGKCYGRANYGPYVSGVCTVYTANPTSAPGVLAGGELTIMSNAIYISNGGFSIPATAKLINYSIVTIDNPYGLNTNVSGTLINYGKIISTQGGYDSIQMNAGSVVENYGTFQATHAVTTSALLVKIGGTLKLYTNSKLLVGNAKSPVKCTLNTADSKDIFMFGCISNGNGSTYGLFFAFDGGSYLPNNLVTAGSVLMEQTNF